MRICKLLLVVGFVFFFYGVGHTQTTLHIGGDLTIVTSPEEVKDMIKTGFGFKVGLGFEVSPQVTLLPNIQYVRLGLDDKEFLKFLAARDDIMIIPPLSEIDVEGGINKSIGVMLDAKYFVSPKSDEQAGRIFLLAGLGFFHSAEMGDATLSATGYNDLTLDDLGDSSTDLAFNLGMGFDLSISPKSALFLEGKYLMVFDDDDESDGNTNCFCINGGISFGLGK